MSNEKTAKPEAEQEAKETACTGNCLECDDSPCPEILNDWGRLQQILDLITDINDKINFLQSIISGNKYICYDGHCPIFQKIIDLRGQLADFDLPVTDINNIERFGMTEQRRKILRNRYKQAKYECDLTLQEIMRVATVNKAKEGREETAHLRRLELIDKLNESHFPLPLNVKADIEDQLNTKPSEGWETTQQKTKDKLEKQKRETEKNGKTQHGK